MVDDLTGSRGEGKAGVAFDKAPLPEVMASLHRERATGKLTVTTDGGHRDLVFVDGSLRAARSTLDEEKIGSWLVANGVVNENHMALSLLAQLGASSSPLGRLLAEGGHVDQEVVEDSLEALASAIIEHATVEQRRDICFLETSSQDAFDEVVRTPTPELILKAARMVLDADAHAAVLEPGHRVASFADPIGCELTRVESALVEVLQGLEGTSLETLRDKAPLNDRDFSSALYSLVVAGFVTLDEPTEEPVAAAEPAEVDGAAVDPELELDLKRAQDLIDGGDAPAAVRLLEGLFEARQRPEYLLKKAQVMAEQWMQPQHILRTLRRLLELAPGSVDGWFELARYWRRGGNRERERRALERVLTLDPDNRLAVERVREMEDG
jgi:hypothetical protein